MRSGNTGTQPVGADRLAGESGQGLANRLPVADSTGAVATTQMVEAQVVASIRALMAAPRAVRIYPPGHQRIEAQLEELASHFGRLFRLTHGHCCFAVRNMTLEVNRKRLVGAPDLEQSFALSLRERQIRRLTLHPGLGRHEIAALVQLLATEHREFLRAGGVAAFLPEGQCPHVTADLLHSPHVFGDGLHRLGLPAAVLEALGVEAIGEGLDAVHELFRELAPADSTVSDSDLCETLSALFARPEWSELSEDEIRAAFENLLTEVQTGLREALGEAQDGRDAVARIASLKSMFQDLTPQSRAPGEEPELKESTVDYHVDGVRALLGEAEDGCEPALQTLQEQTTTHDVRENSLLILGDIMCAQEDPEEYQETRAAFLGAMGDPRYPSASVAKLLHFVTVEEPTTSCEEREALIQAVIESTADDEAVLYLLTSLQQAPANLDLIVARLARGPNPFPLLARTLGEPLPKAIREAIHAHVVNAAARCREALRHWAVRCPREFLTRFFNPLFARAPILAAGPCREILLGGSRRDRVELLRRLSDQGSEAALRLLLQGLPSDGRPCDPGLLEAIGGFRHPRAVRALAQVVEAANLGGRMDEALSALRQLGRIGTSPAMESLKEVATGRRLVLFRYPARLRSFARKLMEGKCR